MRRAGVIDGEERVELGMNYLTGAGGEHSADDASECSTAVSSMNRTLPSDASTACREDMDYGRRKKNIRLLQLDASIMNERDIDFELLEYLTSPASVQRLNPEMWQGAWEHVCQENPFLVMKEDESDQESGQCPYCNLCSKWAEIPPL